MDSEDQRKTTLSEHDNHGVHLCHKCGWPFPNPHPSAKHRRAHKRICGTIEGYKLTSFGEHTQLAASDDEHKSDEDCRSPSPKIEKKNTQELDTGGICERSGRSEDEFFSDAVSEFPEGGFSPLVKHLETARVLDKNVGEAVEGDSSASQSLKVDATAESSESLKVPTESSMYNPEAPESATGQWRNASPFEDVRTEETAIGISGDLSPVKFETDFEEPLTKIATTASEVAEPPSNIASETSEVVSKLPETDEKTSEPVTANEIIQSKEEQYDVSGPEMSKYDHSPELDSVEQKIEMVASNNTVQGKADCSQDIECGSQGDLLQVCDTKKHGEKDMHVLSVADLPVVDQPELMIEDFKDHKALKSRLPVTLDHAEVSRSEEDDNKGAVYEDDHSSYNSSKVGGNGCSASADIYALEHDLQQEGEDKKLTMEVSVEQKANASEFKAISDEDLGFSGLEAAPDTSISEVQEIQKNQCREGLQSHSFENESSRDDVLQNTTVDLSDVIPMVTSVEDEFNAELNRDFNVADHEMCQPEKFAAAKFENKGVMVEQPSSDTRAALESVENLSISEVDQAPNLLGEDNMADCKNARIGLSDVADNESTETAVSRDKCTEDMNKVLESACQLSESTDLDRVPDPSKVDVNTSNFGNLAQCPSNVQPDEETREATKKLNIANDTEVPRDSVGIAGMGNHNGDLENGGKNLENTILKEPKSLPTDSKFSVKSSATVDDSHDANDGTSASVTSSGPFQEEDDGKFTKQPGGISAVDLSVDSSSQTDSLEGNWGSVSVLSIQSDAPAAVDAETIPSTDSSRAFQKSAAANLHKPKPASEECRSEKSDPLEPPSFMSLVESGSGIGPKTASESQTIQSNLQPNSEALQAGWFPSLTNVVNESQGRRKNEEVIAKVTNWSAGKPHSPLKTLLGENNVEAKPKSPNPKPMPIVIQKDDSAANKGDGSVTTVNSILGSEATTDQDSKKEIRKEWNSPARYPADDKKKQKRKAKGKPYWVQFVCCSSAN